MTLPVLESSGGSERIGAEAGVVMRPRQREGLGDPLGALDEVPAHLPEAPQPGRQAKDPFDILPLQRPAERRPDVAVLLLEAVEPPPLVRAHDRSTGPVDERAIDVRVACP